MLEDYLEFIQHPGQKGDECSVYLLTRMGNRAICVITKTGYWSTFEGGPEEADINLMYLGRSVFWDTSATDRQIVLVNTARILKYLEDFGQRQSQLFTVLEKYHLVPDNLENLQSQFSFLKEATSRNVENLQQAITVQQTYIANLYTDINNILPDITKLEDAIVTLEQKFTTVQDTIQINALDFDLDIDRPNLPRAHNNIAIVSVQEQLNSPEPEISYATNFQEETTDRDPPDTTYNNLEESHGYDNFPQHIQNHTTE